MRSEITGKEVKYLKPDTDTYVEGLVNGGVPKEIASFLAGFGIAIGKGEFDTYRSDLEKLSEKNRQNSKNTWTVFMASKFPNCGLCSSIPDTNHS